MQFYVTREYSPDLFARMPWLVRGVLLYGMLFFGRREVNEFIYFAF
jgi:hypothetical protein